jgi:hypothetical protein
MSIWVWVESGRILLDEKILELAKTAHSRYLEQGFAERRRLLDIVLWKLAERVGFAPLLVVANKELNGLLLPSRSA